MTDRLTPEAEARAKDLLEKIDTDWPSIEKTLSGWAVMEHIHGRPYTGPSIDFNGAWQLLRDLLAELARVRQERDDNIKRLAECYRLSGADTDGNEDWRLAGRAVEEVRRLRDDSDREAAIRQRLRYAMRDAIDKCEEEERGNTAAGHELKVARKTVEILLAELTRLEQEGS